MAQADGAVYINTKMDTNGIDKGVQFTEKKFRGMTQNVGGMVSKIAGLMVSAFAVGKLIQFGKEAIDLGSSLSEVQNVVDVTFGDLNSEVNEFAKNAIKQFGLSETSAKQFSSTMGAMLKSMGFTTREAADMGMNIAGLAGDIASFYNLDASEAFAKIRSGISGETEPLKQLGINLSVANLEQFALAQGMTKSYSAMSQQEQALLRYNYLLSVTSDAQGDFSRTSEGWANQTRILSEQFNSLKATLGQGLINLLTPLLKQLNQLISYLQKAADAFLRFTQIITGKSEVQQASNDVQSQAEAYEEVTEATEEAEKAQSNFLTGMDEIHKFNEEEVAAPSIVTEAESTGASAPVVAPSVDTAPIEETETIFSGLARAIETVLNLLNKLKSGFKKAFGNLSSKLEPLKESFGGIKDNLDGVKDKLINVFSGSATESAFEALGNLAGNAFSGLISVVNMAAQAINWLLQTLQPLIDFFIGIFSDTMEDAGSRVDNMNTIFTDVMNTLTQLWNEVLVPLGEFIASVLQPIFEKVIYVFQSLWDNAIHPLIQGIQEVFMAAWEAVVAYVQNVLIPWWNKLIAVFKFLWENILKPVVDFIWSAVKPVFDNLMQTIKNTIDRIKTVLKGVFDFIAGIFSGDWEKAWKGLKEILAGLLNGIIDGINGVIAAPFKGINWVLEKLKSIDILGIEPFGWIKLLPIPQIPRLATGAVIPPNAPFMAVLGDQRNGTNLEAPEGLIRKIIREEMGGQQGFNGTIRVPVVLDGRTITEVVIDRAMLMRAQSGKNPFALA